MPDISIIVPCYNQGAFLADALNSVLSQTYADWECIIVNDGSTDHTAEVAAAFVAKDSRIKYIAAKNAGVCAARNLGIANSIGRYILPLDADDYIADTYLEKAIPILENDADIKIVYAEAAFFGELSGAWPLPDFSIIEISLHNIIYSAALFRRSDFEATTGYDNAFSAGWEDWDQWVSLLEHGGTAYRIPETLFFYRKKIVSRDMAVRNEPMLQETIKRAMFNKHREFYFRVLHSFQAERQQLTYDLATSNKRRQLLEEYLKTHRLKNSIKILLGKKILKFSDHRG